MARHDDDYYLTIAITEATQALRYGYSPAGAVVAGEQGHVYAAAQSRREPGNIWHAELRALLDFQGANRRYGERVTLYAVLEPCIMCIGVATMARISRVVYLIDDPWGGAQSIYNMDSPYIKDRMPTLARGEYPHLAASALALWTEYLGPYNVRKMFHGGPAHDHHQPSLHPNV